MVINENSTSWLELVFLDRREDPVTPTSVEYQIRAGSQIILEYTPIPPLQETEIEITFDQNAILSEFENERFQENTVTIDARMDNGSRQVEEFKYKIKNLGYTP